VANGDQPLKQASQQGNMAEKQASAIKPYPLPAPGEEKVVSAA
jgi:hypothetical protein